MSDEYGNAREELGRLTERKEIVEEILRHIEVCQSLRDAQEKGTPQRSVYTNALDVLIFVTQRIQARGV